MRRPTRHLAAGHVLVTAVVALLLGGLLNAPSLLQTAQTQPLGLKRDIALAVAQPMARISSAMFLDRPRLAVDQAMGRGVEIETPPPAPEAPVDAAATPEPLPTTDFQRPPPRREGPVTAWIIGDSLVELLGPHLSNRLHGTDRVETQFTFRYISGLSRPDFFDWPARMRQQSRSDPADIVVAMFGGNDGQSVAVDGAVYEVWTPEWFDLYQRRVGEAMDALFHEQVYVYWLGLPIMRSDTFSDNARQMNRVYRQEAERRPWVRYVDTWDVFADERGRYAEYLPDTSGRLQPMRYGDGVHFTPQGAVRLARFVFDVLASEWGLEPAG